MFDVLFHLPSVWADHGSDGNICGRFAHAYRGTRWEHEFGGYGDFIGIFILGKETGWTKALSGYVIRNRPNNYPYEIHSFPFFSLGSGIGHYFAMCMQNTLTVEVID